MSPWHDITVTQFTDNVNVIASENFEVLMSEKPVREYDKFMLRFPDGMRDAIAREPSVMAAHELWDSADTPGHARGWLFPSDGCHNTEFGKVYNDLISTEVKQLKILIKTMKE